MQNISDSVGGHQETIELQEMNVSLQNIRKKSSLLQIMSIVTPKLSVEIIKKLSKISSKQVVLEMASGMIMML